MLSKRHRRGFTLLEVMVAVAILAIALTAIFASEAGAIRAGARARWVTTATLLARCKMAEIEEQMLREGLPAVSAVGTDECCEEGDVEGFECEWEVSRIVLPDAALAEDGSGEAEAGEGEEPSAPTSVDSVMSMMGSGDLMSQLAMQYAFPVIKPQLEEQVRRARVTVRWHEGTEEQSFDVVQFLVAEQPPALLTQQAADQAIGAMNGTTSGTSPQTTSPSSPQQNPNRTGL